MDRHLAALLELCSFKFLYKPTNRTVNLLNTVADVRRQATSILPESTSVDIPTNITRRSRDSRSNHPLYGGTQSSSRSQAAGVPLLSAGVSPDVQPTTTSSPGTPTQGSSSPSLLQEESPLPLLKAHPVLFQKVPTLLHNPELPVMQELVHQLHQHQVDLFLQQIHLHLTPVPQQLSQLALILLLQNQLICFHLHKHHPDHPQRKSILQIL